VGLKNQINALKEYYMYNVMKHSGYTAFDVRGDDSVVNTYFKKIGLEKSIKIKGYTYPINRNKKMIKNGMPYFVFTRSAFGEDKHGNTTIKKIDGDILTELIKKARLVGQNTVKSDSKMYLYMVLGGAIGFLLCWVVLSMIGG